MNVTIHHMADYPRFSDGKMRVALHEYEGPYSVGWVFVPTGSLARLLSQPASRQLTKFSQPELEDWYKGYVADMVASGIESAHEDTEVEDPVPSAPAPEETVSRRGDLWHPRRKLPEIRRIRRDLT